MAAPTVKLFFLVAGYDYSKEGSLDFWRMCTGRVRERIHFLNTTLAAKTPLVTEDTTLRFLRFNIGTGKIEVIDKSFVVGKGVAAAVVNESDWKPLSSVGTGDDFDPVKFVSAGPFRAIDKPSDYINRASHYANLDQSVDKPDIISIADVYASVRDAPSQSVLELSFFSHGWIEGPVLVNSNDRFHDPVTRDPRDKDGRAALDFKLTMGVPGGSPTAIFEFMASFADQSIMQAWGCNFDIELRVVQQTNTAMAKAKAARKAFTDDTVIDFEFEDWAPDRYQVTDPGATFFPPTSATTTMSRKFSEVKKFLRKRLSQSYAFQFAMTSISRTGIGALPGTEGDDEKHGFMLMQVCALYDPPECPVGFAALFDFFKKNLGIGVESRGYGVFDPATIQKLNTDIAADGP